MPYDYERSLICKATGLTGIQAEHIAQNLKKYDIDPQTIDWEGAISDSRDWGDRYRAVQRYLADYYGISFSADSPEAYNFKKYNLEDLEFQASTKKGVKQLLNDYYYSKRSKKQKEAIKEILLSAGPIHDVLMTAMYDGIDLPNARRFLNEAMQNEVIDIKPTKVTEVEIKKVLEKTSDKEKPVVEPVKHAMVEVRPGYLIPRSIRPEKYNGNGKKKKYSIDIDKLYNEILKDKQKQREFRNISFGPGARKPLPSIEKKGLWNVFSAGVSKESERWKKLLSQKGPKHGSIDALRREVAILQMKNLPLRLQLERQRLLMQREQMLQLEKLYQMRERRSGVQHALGLLGFTSPQQMGFPLLRPGYYIETRPKLPTGFRYKKIRKKDIEHMKEHMEQPNPMMFMY